MERRLGIDELGKVDKSQRATLFKKRNLAYDAGCLGADLEESKNFLLFRKLYWTDTRNAVGAGQVGRMNTDGSGVEIVYSQLNWPRGIVVDHRRKFDLFDENWK